MRNSLLIITLLTLSVFSETPLVNTDGVGTKSRGMSNNYTAVSNDYSAIFWNPAGLAFLPIREIHTSVEITQLSSDTRLTTKETNYRKSQFDFKSIGFLSSFPTSRGGFTIALGYSSPYNLSEIEKYSGFDIYVDNNELLVNNNDTLHYGDTLFYDNTKYFSNGKLGLFTASSGWQIAENLGFGISISLIKGNLKTHKSISTHTIKGIFDDGADVKSETQYTGFDIRFGGLYKINSLFSTGLRIEFPQKISFDRKLTQYGFEENKKGLLRSYFRGSIGTALTLPFSTVAADMNFSSPHPEIDNGDLSYWKLGGGVGLEIPIKNINSIFRFGYSWKEFDLFPYAEYINNNLQVDNNSSIDGTSGVNSLSGGVSFVLSESILLDASYNNTFYSTEMRSSDWKYLIKKDNFMHHGTITFSIRY